MDSIRRTKPKAEVKAEKKRRERERGGYENIQSERDTVRCWNGKIEWIKMDGKENCT